MPSSSPTARRNSSSVSSRNFSGSSPADVLSPRGLQQSFYTTSSNFEGSRALHENVDDHKENSTENGSSRGAPGRSNQSQKGHSKKPWVTHFAKPATTVSPSNRVLVDRNSSWSPVRVGSIASGSGETLSDKKVVRPATPTEREDAPVTPGPGKGVADLSKRIQQFLEDQDVLLGVKTGSSKEITSTCPSVTPVEPGQRPLSSPYNPYKSPFFERPKFLRLNGNISSIEGANIVSAPVDVPDLVMEPPTEELPLFEGDQVLVTPLHHIQFSTSLSPSSNEDEEVRLEEDAKEQILGAVTVKEASVDALDAEILPISGGEVDCPQELKAEVMNERTGKPHEDGDEIGTVQASNQFQDGENRQGELKVSGVEVKNVTVNSAPQEDKNLSLELAKTDEVVDTVDIDDVSWGKKAVRMVFCGALLATFLALVLLSSASSGLLPPSLVNNPVNSLWQSSKYHERSMMLVRGLDGLWSTEMVYFPADACVPVSRGAELFQAISELFHQIHKELRLHVHVASSTVEEWWRVLFQPIYVSTKSYEHEDRTRQFEWMQDYEFEGEWVDELPKLAYTDWELLHEYDLGAANQFILGSIPESLKNDLQRNFSRLSDSPEVRDLLEDLMKLKGGSTEEDRLEVLQYFWEYRRFSASAHKSLIQAQLETTAIEDGSKIKSDHQDMESDPENVEMDHDKGQQKTQFMDSKEHIDEDHYHTPPTGQHFGHFEEDEQQSDDLAEHLLEKLGIKQGQIVPEMCETASEKLQEAIVHENSQTLLSTAYENDAAWTDSVHELQRAVGNEDTSSTDVHPIQPTSDVRLDIAQLATLATFLVASFLILGRNRQSKNATKLLSHASGVQFLRKSDQPPSSVNDEAMQNRQPFADVKQDNKQVTMIEKLNDRFASVLQSPEPNNLHLRSPHARKDEDLLRSPIPTTSASSPYGSFTTYKLMSKKEGQATETKLTPLRRSSRIRNHVSMSPNANGAKRIALSPP